MGPGSGTQGDGVGWIKLFVAPLDESLNEGEALAQGSYYDVSAIFAALLRECGDQVVGDECQLGVRIFCCKVGQLIEPCVAQTCWIGQERHAGRDRLWYFFGRRQGPCGRLPLARVE